MQDIKITKLTYNYVYIIYPVIQEEKLMINLWSECLVCYINHTGHFMLKAIICKP